MHLEPPIILSPWFCAMARRRQGWGGVGNADEQMLSIYSQLSRTSGIHKSPLFCLILKPPAFIYPTL